MAESGEPDIAAAGRAKSRAGGRHYLALFKNFRKNFPTVPAGEMRPNVRRIVAACAMYADFLQGAADNLRIAQAGGLAALDGEGQKEIRSLTDFYLGNAQIIRSALQKIGIHCTGGDNSPYIWSHFPGRDSWEVFSEILEKCQVVTTPGAGFGPAGGGYVRFSAFGHRNDVEEACRRLEQLG